MRVKTEEKRQAIIDIAKEAFFSQGFEQTSMSHIAQLLGGSKATLYNYFNSKEEIFNAVMESSATAQIANAFKALTLSRELRHSLIEFGVNYLDSILTPEIMAIHRMVMANAGGSDLGRHFYEQGPKCGWQSFSEFLSQQMDNGHIVSGDPWLAAMQFKGLVEAEIVFPFSLGAAEKPTMKTLKRMVETAVNSFLSLHASHN